MSASLKSAPVPSVMTDLADREHFIVYRLAPLANGRTDKIPIDPDTRRNIDAHDRANWMRGDLAWTYAQMLGAGYGCGIVLYKGCGIVGLDIDKAFLAGEWNDVAKQLCARFAGAYIEVSPSGTGVRILFSATGEIPPHSKKNTRLHIEMYSDLRFLTITGTHASGRVTFDGTPLLAPFIAEYFPASDESADDAQWTTEPAPECNVPDEDQAIIAQLLNDHRPRAIFGTKARTVDLWHGNADALCVHFPPQSPGQDFDRSSADLALANIVIYYTGGDCERAACIMRQAPIASDREEKWNRVLRSDILKARRGRTKFHIWRASGKSLPKAPVPSDADPREVILLNAGQLDQYAARAEQLLAGDVYTRGRRLVRIGQASELPNLLKLESGQIRDAQGVRRDAAQAVCLDASAAWLRRALMSRAAFWKFDKRSSEYEPKDCPKELVENIADQRAWPSIDPLIAIAAAPFLRADMTVCETPGYDRHTGIFYAPTGTFPPIPSAPTRADADAALRRLCAPFLEFPYGSDTPDAALAAVIAHILTLVQRPSFTTSPPFFYTASMAGTGKTLLVQMVSLLAQGTAAAERPYTEKEELRKVLLAALIAGDVALTFDNVPNGAKVRSDVLARFTTSAFYSDRILGVSESPSFPNRTTVAFTGNSITPVGDMARRSIVIQLDVNAESARGRNFTIADLPAYIYTHRPSLIVDALTVILAYAVAGCPSVARPLESFEQWSRIARDPLVWLGMGDPVSTQANGTDDEIAPLRLAFDAIATVTAAIGNKFTAVKLAPISGGIRDVLIDAGCSEPSDAIKLGYWLRSVKDRVAGGWKLVNHKLPRGGSEWELRAFNLQR